MNNALHFLALACLLLAATPARAETKVGTVDMKKVFADYHRTKSADEEMRRARTDLKKRLDEQTEDIKVLEIEVAKAREELKKLESNSAAWTTPAALLEEQAKTKEWQNAIKARADFLDERTKEIEASIVRLRNEITQDVVKAVNEQAKLDGYDLVFDTSGSSHANVRVVMHANKAFDFTQAVLDRLNSGWAASFSSPAGQEKEPPSGHWNWIYAGLGAALVTIVLVRGCWREGAVSGAMRFERPTVGASHTTVRPMKIAFHILVLALAMAWVSDARAETKVGTVDMKTVFASYYKTKEENARVQPLREQLRSELAALNKEIARLEAVIAQTREQLKQPGFSDGVRQGLVKRQDAEMAKWQAAMKSRQELTDVRTKEIEAQIVRRRNALVADITQAIQKIVRQRGYDLVFDTSGFSVNEVPVLLHARKGFDFTRAVLDALNANQPGGAAAATAQESARTTIVEPAATLEAAMPREAAAAGTALLGPNSTAPLQVAETIQTNLEAEPPPTVRRSLPVHSASVTAPLPPAKAESASADTFQIVLNTGAAIVLAALAVILIFFLRPRQQLDD